MTESLTPALAVHECWYEVTGGFDEPSRDFTLGFNAATRLTATQAPAEPLSDEPDCWAVLTPNGSKLVSPDEAKGRKDAYPLFTRPAAVRAQAPSAEGLRD
jgi:hypothetical protein